MAPEILTAALPVPLHATLPTVSERVALLDEAVRALGGDPRPARAAGGLATADLTDLRVTLATSQDSEGARLILSVASLPGHPIARSRQTARLAMLSWQILRRTQATAVLWLSAATPLPRAAFLAALAPELMDSAPAGGGAGVTAHPHPAPRAGRAPGPTPRRVARAVTAVRRPRLAAAPALPSWRAGRGSAATTFRPAGAALHAAEAILRREVLRDAAAEEIAELRADMPVVPVRARLATFAVSFGVAAVAMPLGLPALTAALTGLLDRLQGPAEVALAFAG